MRKFLLFNIIMVICFCLKSSAQDKRTSVYGVEMRTNALEVGADYLIAGGDFGKIYSDNGFGAAVRYRFAITEFKSLLLSVGYNTFSGKLTLAGNNPTVNLRSNFIPIKVGIKFRFLKYIYMSGEIGSTIGLGVKNVDKINPYVAQEYQIKGALFNFAPTLGIQIPTKNKNYLDLGIRYEGMSYNNGNVAFFTGLRAAYGFNIAR